MARELRDAVNRHGCDVTLVPLPEIGLRRNTHFPMSDLNNVDVAEHTAGFLENKGLFKLPPSSSPPRSGSPAPPPRKT